MALDYNDCRMLEAWFERLSKQLDVIIQILKENRIK
jgi:hypothetical protein